MNRLRRIARRIFPFLLLLGLAAGLVAPSRGVPPAVAGGGGPLGFYPQTLVDFGPGGGNDPGVLWFAVSGDWVAYATGFSSCGHCGLTTTAITLHNVLTGQTRTIHGSLWTTNDTSAGPVGMVRPVLVAPYLVWSQPGPPTPDLAKTYQYTPGDLACTSCLFNLSSGEGGPVLALQALLPGNVNPYLVSALALDGAGSGRVLTFVDNNVPGGPRGVDALWLVDLKTGDTQQVPLTAPTFTITEGAFYGSVVAWNQDTHDSATSGLYVYRPGDHSVRALPTSAGAYNVQSDGVGLFWVDPAGPGPVVIRTDLEGGQTQPLAMATATYQLAGDRMAWVESSGPGAPQTLDVQQVSTGQTLLRTQLPAGKTPDQRLVTTIRLSADKLLLYNAADYLGSPAPLPLTLQLAWLVAPDPAFGRVWTQADGPVAARKTTRSWLWGPGVNYLGRELYAESPGGTRLVQYYDKSRMEVNNPSADPNGPAYVSNGLLVAELMSGEIRVGDTAVITASIPATIPVAGDPRAFNPLTPGYADLAHLASLHGENQAPDRTGQDVDDQVDVHGVVSKVQGDRVSLASYATFVSQTGHNIPDVFWPYLQTMQGVYGFDWTFVLGYPITEGYWTEMRVGGQDYPVLIQAYQRRVLTFAPDFPLEWRLQQGNVGQHYLEWRTRNLGIARP